MEKPLIRKRRSISPIWILPLVALCIGGWLLYTTIRDAGVEITVHFQDATGITPGKTKVIVKGIPVGTVKRLEVDEGMQGVNLVITMERQTRSALVEDTTFWVVRPEVSAGRISGLDTLFGGAYIGMRKGGSTSSASRFEGLTEQPSLDTSTPGLHITLETDTLYSLQRGSNIYTKNLQIGYLEDYSLQDNGKIVLKAFIDAKFAHLIHTGTRFWNASGLSLTGDVQSGLTVNVESLASLIYGGITCATPPSQEQTEPADNRSTFKLHKDFEDAEYGISMTLQLASGEGIVAGKTKVMYRGLKTGVVKNIDINNDQFHTVTATLLLDPRAEVILKERTRFWIVRPEVNITGIKHLETLLTGPFITFEIGEGKPQDRFVEETTPMAKPTIRPGTQYTLVAPDSGGLAIGAPVLYKQIAVGEVTGLTLAPKGEAVQIRLLLHHPYQELINKKTVFWNAGGVKVDASLSRLQVNLGSVQSLLAGGVAFANPPLKSGTALPPAEAESTFKIFDSYGEAVKAVPELERKGLRLQLLTAKAPPLTVGAPVLYNNIKVGEVLGFDLAKNRRDTLIQLLVNDGYRDLVTGSSRFYTFAGVKFTASLQGVNLETAPLDALLNGGIAFLSGAKGDPLRADQPFVLYESQQEAINADALRLSLHFGSGEGITKNTEIKYQGISLGKVTGVRLDPTTSGVHAEVCVPPEMARLFRKTTTLRLVRPEVSLAGVRHIETMLSGAYVDVRAGSGPAQTEFTVVPLAADTSQPVTGLNIVLESPTLGSLKQGSPVSYRQVKVGQITGIQLSPTAQEVWLFANIEPPYAKLIYTGTKFWNASGVKVSGGVMSGMTVSTESMEALLTGGVALATPEDEKRGGPVAPGHHFPLVKTAEEGWLQWQPQLPPPAAGDQEKKAGKKEKNNP
jgi:paraquat-inducible protein B